jgi:hypothetical protein
MLLTDTGSPVDCGCDQAGPVGLHRVVDRGRYYLVVRSTTGSKGSYKLTLLVREVTNTQLLLDGSSSIDVVPDQAVQAVAEVTSATGGPSTTAVGGNVRFQFDRLDPFSGWQFVQLHTVRVAADSAARLTWVPPSVGHWRAHAVFWGTLGAAPSETEPPPSTSRSRSQGSSRARHQAVAVSRSHNRDPAVLRSVHSATRISVPYEPDSLCHVRQAAG